MRSSLQDTCGCSAFHRMPTSGENQNGTEISKSINNILKSTTASDKLGIARYSYIVTLGRSSI